MTPVPTAQAAAWVDGEVITVEEVDARMAALRDGTFGARLPGANTAEGRNARRWIVQLLCAERVVLAALTARGIVPSQPRGAAQLHRALRLGGVAAALLAAVPEIAELVESWALPINEAAARSYYDRNHDLFAERGVSFESARPSVVAVLQSEVSDREFSAWLERQVSTSVVLARGFEHPAEPGHPDSTHRH